MNSITKLVVTFALIAMSTTADAQDVSRRFYEAVRQEDLGTLKALVRTNQIDFRDQHGTTPLMYAAFGGSAATMRLLLDSGANANARNDFGATALIWAAGDFTKARLLIAYGADVNAKSLMDRTPLMIAAYNDNGLDTVNLLLQHGAKVNVHDSGGTTPLHLAALESRSDVVRSLLEHGATPDAKDAAGVTPLLIASSIGNPESTRLLLARGCDAKTVTIDVMQTVKNGTVLLGRIGMLDFASSYGGPEVISQLLAAGASVNAVDTGGMTPLMRAVSTDRPSSAAIQLLLNRGADPHQRTTAMKSTLDWAAEFRNAEVYRALGVTMPPAKPSADHGQAFGIKNLDSKTAVRKSLDLLQSNATRFLERGGCISCHAQNLTGLAVSASRSRGIRVDEQNAASITREVITLRSSPEQQFLQLVDSDAGPDGLMYSLLQMSAAGVPPSRSTDAILHYLASVQRDDHWVYFPPGRPPIEDGNLFITALGLRSLQLYMIPGRTAEFAERIRRAGEWLARATPISTSDRVMQLLGIYWATGRYPPAALKELTGLEKKDGGWAQTRYLQSDAYGTGLVLYALHELGIPSTDPVYRRGVKYLLEHQEADGSWHVRSRSPKFQPYFESGFPHGHDQWISQAATAWATMALAYSIPKTSLIAAK